MRIHGSRDLRALAVVACAALALAACDTAKLDNARTFAASGVVFADSMPPLYDAAYETKVDLDGALLARSHPDLDAAGRKSEIEQSMALLEARRAILNDLSAHAGLLKEYFASLEALAQSDAPAAAGAAAADAAGKLQSASDKFKDAKIGPAAPSDIVGAAAKIIVTARVARELDARLGADADLITRELDLHGAALALLAESVEADAEALAQFRRTNEVLAPYRRAQPLPPGWRADWAAMLGGQDRHAALVAAEKALKDVRAAYVALATDKLTAGQAFKLLRDVSKL